MANLFALPEDLIFREILTRLPVKSLIRFRFVCKSWRFFLSNPDSDFIRSHLARTSHNPNYESLICNTHNPNDRWINRSLMEMSIITNTSKLSNTRLDNVPNRTKYILGSINGLVCLYWHHHFCVWNPATAQVKAIAPPCHLWKSSKNWVKLFGFGWDRVADDYKVIVCYRWQSSMQSLMQLVVYTCSTDTWTELVAHEFLLLYLFDRPSPDTIVEGCCYWARHCRVKSSVIKYEVGSNEFNEFLLPDFDFRRFKLLLVNLKDFVAVMVYNLFSGKRSVLVDVYFLDEGCGVWSKIYTIGPIPSEVTSLSYCFKYGGEILFNDVKRMYDHKTNEIKVIHDKYCSLGNCFSYTASLVFIKGMEPLHTNSHWRLREIEQLEAYWGPCPPPVQTGWRLLVFRLLSCLPCWK